MVSDYCHTQMLAAPAAQPGNEIIALAAPNAKQQRITQQHNSKDNWLSGRFAYLLVLP